MNKAPWFMVAGKWRDKKEPGHAPSDQAFLTRPIPNNTLILLIN